MEVFNFFWIILFITYAKKTKVIHAQRDYGCVNGTTTCDPAKCKLPDCRCWGYDTPGGLTIEETPQMILFTFMREFDENIYSDIRKVFKRSRRNPNGGHIGATLYVTGLGTDYCSVRKLWEDGHEIASHALSYKEYQYRWQEINESEWRTEMVGERNNISENADIDQREIRGMRAPYLQSGGDVMYTMLGNAGFQYDSTMTYQGANSNDYHGWPVTLDFPTTYTEARSHPLPTKCYNGIWEIPARYMIGTDNVTRCTLLDFCELHTHENKKIEPTVNDTYNLFKTNFDAYYTTNKAPIMFNINTGWFKRSRVVVEAMTKFLDEVEENDDVYIVTTWQAIQWMKQPTRLEGLYTFRPWRTARRDKKKCKFTEIEEEDGENGNADEILEGSSIFDTIFSGNGLIAIEILFLVVSALFLILRDNADE